MINTLKTNKIIAKFMGKKMISEFDNPLIAHLELKYHSSWNWLMPVVNKINNFKEKKYSIHIVRNFVSFNINNNVMWTYDSHSLRESIYMIVIKAIEYINKYDQN